MLDIDRIVTLEEYSYEVTIYCDKCDVLVWNYLVFCEGGYVHSLCYPCTEQFKIMKRNGYLVKSIIRIR